jgi:DNA-binding transcriptional regulator GbsR (MarR family)
MNLSPVTEKFVLHWGEMGTRWGVSRTVAQIHALLYLSERALHAEEIAETLSVARSNVSTSLKELQGWGLIKVVHVMGDRRDHFMALQDITDLFRVIVEERKRREIDPTLAVLRDCVGQLEADTVTPPSARERIVGQLEFLETVTSWYESITKLPRKTLLKMMRLGARIGRVIGD